MKTVDKMTNAGQPLHEDSKLRTKLINEVMEVLVPTEVLEREGKRIGKDARELLLWFVFQALFVPNGKLTAPPWAEEE